MTNPSFAADSYWGAASAFTDASTRGDGSGSGRPPVLEEEGSEAPPQPCRRNALSEHMKAELLLVGDQRGGQAGDQREGAPVTPKGPARRRAVKMLMRSFVSRTCSRSGRQPKPAGETSGSETTGSPRPRPDGLGLRTPPKRPPRREERGDSSPLDTSRQGRTAISGRSAGSRTLHPRGSE